MIGFVAYEAAPGLEPKFEIRPGYEGPLVWFGAYPDGRIGGSTVHQPSWQSFDPPVEKWSSSYDSRGYRQKVESIIDGIVRGDYYQVNLTERFTAQVASPVDVYERIRLAQQAPYSAYIETAEMAVLSVSPELFLHRSGSMIESRPMKGTSRRGRWAQEDDELARLLASSEKERAENVMIVDLIRNDMGRIAVPGSVDVPSMFTVERYPTVLQMTSHVKSQLKPGVTLADIFAALFPCGSVTGAPKIAASTAIAAHEETPRGPYCGAVGVVRPGGDEFTFNVAIRTAVVDTADGNAIYGAGGGITADSDPDRELAELEAKAAVLTSVPESTDLLETLRLENGRVARLDAHLDRLSRSAEYFGIRSREGIIAAVRRSIMDEASRNGVGLFRLRVILRADGTHSATADLHVPDSRPRRLRLARTPVDSRDRRFYHKLADRTPYTERLNAVAGVDDVILFNERGEVTETTIGNLVLEIDGERVTPALECGLLPGVYRHELLGRREIAERVLRLEDLKRSTRAWMINSLRGWVDCELV